VTTIVCTGGRKYLDTVAVDRALRWALAVAEVTDGTLDVMVGSARGADTLVREWCAEHGVDCTVFVADWKRHGYGAGPIRNSVMIKLLPDLVIAFPGGPGTNDCVRRAALAGIPVHWEPS
jgi:hypothetical protein